MSIIPNQRIDEEEILFCTFLGIAVQLALSKERQVTPTELGRRVSAIVSDWDSGSALCGSPIERRFLSGLLFCRDTLGERAVFAGTEAPPREPHTISAQPQVLLGPYRVDFLLRQFTADGVRQLIVECDGHDFHERTKEQAARDRQRDRFFAQQGQRVIRFTGSEIYADAFACAEEAIAILTVTPGQSEAV